MLVHSGWCLFHPMLRASQLVVAFEPLWLCSHGACLVLTVYVMLLTSWGSSLVLGVVEVLPTDGGGCC